MSQKVKAPADRPDNLGLIPETHLVEGENRISKSFPLKSISEL